VRGVRNDECRMMNAEWGVKGRLCPFIIHQFPMSDPRDYKLDLAFGATRPDALPAPRPFLSVHFACCGAYQRVYRDPDGRAYRGRCPRCGKAVRFPVGEGGTTARYFTVI